VFKVSVNPSQPTNIAAVEHQCDENGFIDVPLSSYPLLYIQ